MNPTPELTQRAMAEKFGWTRLHIYADGKLWGTPPGDDTGPEIVPNWPTDINASKELQVDSRYQALGEKSIRLFLDHIKFAGHPFWLLDGMAPFSLMIQIMAHPDYPMLFCLAWLEDRGIRWVPCKSCGGRGEREQEGVVHKDVTRLPTCPDCNGHGGEFKSVG